MQKTLADNVLAGDRGSLVGPYNVFLRSPEMGDLAQKFGAYTRFHSSVPRKLNEFAILITARYWTSQYEWYAHHMYALQAGLSEVNRICQAVEDGKRPAGMQADEEAVYNFCNSGDAEYAAGRVTRPSMPSKASWASSKWWIWSR